jgi:hypothetical protein
MAEEAKTTEFKKCPRCGWEQTDKPTPDKEDLKEFVRCLLAGKPFCKIYPLYNGAVEAKFSTLSTAEVDNLNDCILNCGKDSELDIKAFSFKAKLLFFLKSLKIDREVKEFEKFDVSNLKRDELAAAVEEQYLKRFGDMPDPLMQLILRTLLLFIDLQNALTAAALDDSFWKAAGPY